MKTINSFELLNSEGPVLTVHNRGNHWTFSFNGSSISLITNITEILSFIRGSLSIKHPTTGIPVYWSDFPDSMKVERDIKDLLNILLPHEIELIKESPEYFRKVYIKGWK